VDAKNDGQNLENIISKLHSNCDKFHKEPPKISVNQMTAGQLLVSGSYLQPGENYYLP